MNETPMQASPIAVNRDTCTITTLTLAAQLVATFASHYATGLIGTIQTEHDATLTTSGIQEMVLANIDNRIAKQG